MFVQHTTYQSWEAELTTEAVVFAFIKILFQKYETQLLIISLIYLDIRFIVLLPYSLSSLWWWQWQQRWLQRPSQFLKRSQREFDEVIHLNLILLEHLCMMEKITHLARSCLPCGLKEIETGMIYISGKCSYIIFSPLIYSNQFSQIGYCSHRVSVIVLYKFFSGTSYIW